MEEYQEAFHEMVNRPMHYLGTLGKITYKMQEASSTDNNIREGGVVKKKSYDICIVGGLGHVGLPLGISFADLGQRVVLYDINEKAIDIVSRGKMPFVEVGAEEMLKKVLGKTLFISSD